MDSQILRDLDNEYKRDDLPEFKTGDTIEVGFKIREGDKVRVQKFRGLCISKKKGPLGGTFTVRKISFSVGVEKTIPLYSPLIDSIKVIRRGKVRKSKLYYLRQLQGKKARVKELRDWEQQAAPSSSSPETKPEEKSL